MGGCRGLLVDLKVKVTFLTRTVMVWQCTPASGWPPWVGSSTLRCTPTSEWLFMGECCDLVVNPNGWLTFPDDYRGLVVNLKIKVTFPGWIP